jgi:hypothetical protein
MGKHEAPAFRMIIEGGRLVPATPYDAERLDTYRRGTKVSVRFTEEKDRVLVRKWWAIIGKAVKECPTPWKTRDEASEAIKLSLGIVNLTKTVGGDWLQYPKSLTELDDPELVDAVEQMVEIIHRVTGVDPDTWKKEIAHVGEDEPSDEVPPSDAGSGAAAPSTGSAADPIASPAGERTRTARDEAMETASATGQQTVGAVSHSSASQGGPEAGDMEARAEPGASSASEPTQLVERALMQECLDKFLAIAADPQLEVKQRRDNLEFAKEAWKAEMPTKQDFVRTCLNTADKVAKGELGPDAARRYLEGLL